MDSVWALLLAAGAAFVINLIPAFMPPTWAALAAIQLAFGTPLLPLAVVGAAASAAGRAGLALGAAKGSRFLPAKDRTNADALGDFFDRHERWSLGIVFVGCLGPLPSNALFIAAGLGRVRLWPVLIAFFLSRCIADWLWVYTAGAVVRGTGDLFTSQLTSWQAILLQVAGLVLVVGVLRLPWARWLGGARRRPSARTGHSSNAR